MQPERSKPEQRPDPGSSGEPQRTETEHSKPERRPEPGSSAEPRHKEPGHSKRPEPEHSTWEPRSNGCSRPVSDKHIAVGSSAPSGNRA